MHEGVDTPTSTGRMVAGILMSIAEYERKLVRERTALKLEYAPSHRYLAESEEVPGRLGAPGASRHLGLAFGSRRPTRRTPCLNAEDGSHDHRQPCGHHVAPMHRQPVQQ